MLMAQSSIAGPPAFPFSPSLHSLSLTSPLSIAGGFRLLPASSDANMTPRDCRGSSGGVREESGCPGICLYSALDPSLASGQPLRHRRTCRRGNGELCGD